MYNILLCFSDGRELEKCIILDCKVNCSSSFQMAQLLGQGGSTASLVSPFKLKSFCDMGFCGDKGCHPVVSVRMIPATLLYLSQLDDTVNWKVVNILLLCSNLKRQKLFARVLTVSFNLNGCTC